MYMHVAHWLLHGTYRLARKLPLAWETTVNDGSLKTSFCNCGSSQCGFCRHMEMSSASIARGIPLRYMCTYMYMYIYIYRERERTIISYVYYFSMCGVVSLFSRWKCQPQNIFICDTPISIHTRLNLNK